VLVDSIQIQQVIVNLITNACDAMESQAIDQRRISMNITQTEEMASVEIIDSGPGLSHDTAEQIFEPFYTSKPNGMAMGLTICSDIIKSHSGTITAKNESNAGAGFRFTLPNSKEINNEQHPDAT
jgi:C4-dicarboxylate-specific signal transduction histidine kinase